MRRSYFAVLLLVAACNSPEPAPPFDGPSNNPVDASTADMSVDDLSNEAVAPEVQLRIIDADPAAVSGAFGFVAEIVNDVDVTFVDFQLDDVFFDSVDVGPFSTQLESSAIGVGDHTMRAIAYDELGNTGSDTVEFTVVDDTVEPPITVLPLLDLSGVWLAETKPGPILRYPLAQPAIYTRFPAMRGEYTLLKTAVRTEGNEVVIDYEGSASILGYYNAGTNDAPQWTSCRRTFAIEAGTSYTRTTLRGNDFGDDYRAHLQFAPLPPATYPDRDLAVQLRYEYPHGSRILDQGRLVPEPGVGAQGTTYDTVGATADPNVPFCQFVGPSVTIPWTRLAGGPGQLDPTGKIEAMLRSSLITVTTPERAVHRATVSLHRQDAWIRPQGPTESDADYRQFVGQQPKQLVKQIDITWDPMGSEPPGAFEFDDVSAIAPRAQGRARTAALYALQITGAETDEDELDANNMPTGNKIQLSFAPKWTTNLLVNAGNQTIDLDPLTGAASKLAVVSALKRICPINYSPTEELVEAWIASLGGAASPAQNEGIRRARWAEQVVLVATDLAEELIEIALKGLATLIADALDDIIQISGRRLTEAKEVQERARVAAMQGRVPAAFNANNVPAEQVQRLSEANRVVKRAELADTINKSIKAMKPLMTQRLVAYGVSVQTAGTIADSTVLALSSILSGVASGSILGATKPRLKKAVEDAVKALKPALMDSASGASPFAFCDLNNGFLDVSSTQMQLWSTDDEATYRADRRATMQQISEMATTASDVLLASRVLAEEATGLDTVQDASAAIGSVFKWVKIVEKVAQVAKYIANGTVFVTPYVYAHGKLPGHIASGVATAYGLDPDDAPITSPLPNNPNADVQMMSSSVTPVITALDEVEAAVTADDIGLAVSTFYGDAATSYMNARRSWNGDLEAQNDQLWSLDGPALENQANLLADREYLRVVEARLETAASTFFAEVLTGEYDGPGDQRYLVARDVLLEQLDWVRDDSSRYTTALNDYLQARGTSGLRPVVTVDEPTVESPMGDELISVPSQTVTVTTTIRNRSLAALSQVSARLSVDSPSGSFTVTGANVENLGNLSSQGSATATWQVQYTGDGSAEVGVVTIEVLEADSPPVAFTATPRNAFLNLAPELFDADLDQMPSSWESAHGLDPNTNDAALDLDRDGLTNIDELSLGLLPDNADSDGDGVTDGEELTGGADGFLTDPLAADTDGDGTDDLSDGAPLDGTTVAAAPSPGEPTVAVGTTEVRLTPDAPFAVVDVTNAGAGSLRWSTRADAPFLTMTPQAPDVSGGSSLLIGVARGVKFRSGAELETSVAVFDVDGADPDEAVIRVVLDGQ